MDGKHGIESVQAMLRDIIGAGGGVLAASALRAAGMMGLGFLLGGDALPFGAQPMGIALVACLPDRVLPAAIGAALRALLAGGGAAGRAGGIACALGVIGLYLLRLLGKGLLPRYFEDTQPLREGAALQVTLGVVCAGVIGITRLVLSGFLYIELFALLVMMGAQPILILAYRCAFDASDRFSVRAEVGQMVLAASAVLALLDANLLGFSLAVALAYFLTLYVSKTGGALRGGVAGCMLGLVCAPVLAPVMGVGGVVAGLLWEKSISLAAVVGLLMSIGCGLYADGMHAMLSPTPDLILGTIAVLPLLRMEQIPRIFTYADSVPIPRLLLSRAAAKERTEREGNARLTALSESMESLSEVFYHLSDRFRKPGAAEVRSLCDRTFRTYCVKCPLTAVCWVREQASTADALTAMTAAVCKEGILHLHDVPSYLSERCKSMPRIVNEINDAHIDALERAARQDKLEVLALDYRAMAGLLSHACRVHAAETTPDPILTKRACKAAEGMGLVCGCMSVVGKRRLQVIASGVDPRQIAISPNRIRQTFGSLLGVQLTPPRFDLEANFVTMTLNAARSFRITSARAGCEKAEEPVSGDSVTIFENREDYCYALISDGMGSGREAAMTSRMCSVFLRTMLAAGNPKGVAIEMLNNFIRNKNLECFATVDLLEIDLLSGHACFVKSGAAPSYILRDGKLFKIASHTLPIGITREIKCEEIRFDLEEGDLILMTSDGVASDGGEDSQGLGDGLWLADMLTFEMKEEDTVEQMCDKILSAARELNQRADDMSVVMMRVEKMEDVKD